MTSLFTADHHGFYHKGVVFDPSQVVSIRLPAGLRDDLNWAGEIERGQEAVDAGRAILWELDLGLSERIFTPAFLAHFSALFLGVDEFCKQILSRFELHTFGVVLYKGGGDFARLFPKEAWEGEWNEDCKEISLDEPTAYLLFCAGILSESLHSLVSLLPDSLLVFALIDISSLSSFAVIAHLFLHERFEHVHLAFKGAQLPCSALLWQGDSLTYQAIPASSGLLLPEDASMTKTMLDWLDQVVTREKEKGRAFRVVAEEKLTEEWDGLDVLITPPEKVLGPQVRRKLKGFVAAGGSICERVDSL
jgi:hypothetical protein